MSAIRWVRACGWAKVSLVALGAAGAFTGCCATRSSCDFTRGACAPAAEGTVVGEACSSCGTVGCTGGCGLHAHGSWRQKLRDYDWEQVRPDHCWPTQYTHESVRRVNEPLAQQMANGLALEATLFDCHFEADDHRAQLSEPGRIRLQYLARRRPYQIGSITLAASYDPALDQARANEVHAYLQKVSFEPGNWQLVVAPVVPTGLTGPEIAGSIANTTGVTAGTAPLTRKYESVLKNTFQSGTGSGAAPGGS